MFTQSCSEVKDGFIVLLRIYVDISATVREGVCRGAAQEASMSFSSMFRFGARQLEAHNENTCQERFPADGTVSPFKARALATGAALATSLDSSPAVLVSIYDYAHRYRDKGRRSA
jgi:hypothetical protein